MANLPKGSYIKIKSSITRTQIADFCLKNLCEKNFPSKAFKIVNFVKNYYTDVDYVVIVSGREYIIPSSLAEVATEEEVRRASWFCDRVLDITAHHKTKIFR